ncbi:MAG TPA: gamma-glutamyltransferase, partial [Lacipirellulaceae bacterium]|nr:gamma-glutamyltransferase [Lacipirellulaceae bacterium]
RTAASAHTATGEHFMLATVNPIATDAGVAVFREGGNAVDAAVTAALTLGVVDGENSGIGGGCLILIRTADGKFTAIDGREMAPAAASKGMFLRDGKPLPMASQTGPLAPGVPGALAAYQVALDRCGTKTLAGALAPGIKSAAEGFTVSRSYADAVHRVEHNLQEFEGSKAVFFRPDGKPIQAGDLFVQSDLANTYRQIAAHGTDWFYRGDVAEKIGNWMAKHGGVLTAKDFAVYKAKVREPLHSTYRGYQIIGFPPPSSGGVHVAEILNILEQFDLGAIERKDKVTATNIIGEAFQLAFADRAYWLGDADFVSVPRGLISKEYAKQLATEIDPKRAIDVPTHGTPPNYSQDIFGRHTTHIAAADAAGNWVAITATVNTTFGSKVIVPGTGVVLNDEMDDFSIYPGMPNAFGLVGAENNSVAPGKRPLSSMSPTIVLGKKGKPVLTVGAAGGPKIITQVVLAIVRVLDFKQSLADAVAGHRFHHQWRPNCISYEKGLAPEIVEGLRERGHNVEELTSAGVTQAIEAGPDGTLIGVADPRAGGKAAGN